MEYGQGRRLGAWRPASLGLGRGRMLALLHGVGYFGEDRLKTAGVGQEGDSKDAVSPTASAQRGVAAAGHQGQGRRPSGQVA
jgi:hypothetical protein